MSARHQRGWPSRLRGGRPKVTEEIRRLVRQMAEESAGWGAPKITANFKSSVLWCRNEPWLGISVGSVTVGVLDDEDPPIASPARWNRAKPTEIYPPSLALAASLSAEGRRFGDATPESQAEVLRGYETKGKVRREAPLLMARMAIDR